MEAHPNIFISYSWQDEDLVTGIETSLKITNLHFIRDVRDIAFMQSIKEYMKRVRKTDYILVVVSDAFLKSYPCMCEILEFMKDENYKDRIVPIIKKDTRFFTPAERLHYTNFWDSESSNLENVIKNYPVETIGDSGKILLQYRNIRNSVCPFLEFLQEHLFIPYDTLVKTGYKDLLNYINYNRIEVMDELIKISSIKNEDNLNKKLNEFLLANPNSAQGYYLKGCVEFKKGNVWHAIENYNMAIEIKVDYSEAYNDRGIAYRKLGKLENAINDYKKATTLNPDYAEFFYNLGISYHEIKDYSNAKEAYNKAIQINPQYTKAYNNRGIVNRLAQNFAEAIKDYTKAIKLRPNYAEAYYNLGLTYFEINEYKKAEFALSLAIKHRINYAKAYVNRGNVYEILQEFDKAIDDYSNAILLNPNDSEAYYYRSTIYDQKALLDMNKAIELGGKIYKS